VPTSPTQITLERIDPINHHLVCGLKNSFNEILAIGSYNYGKTNKFVPYRVCNFEAPVNYGDLGEFLIDEHWIVTEFGGEEWHRETRRVGFGATKNRICHTDPFKHREISALGGKAAVEAGYHFNANGCHTSELQTARVRGRVWWTNLRTMEMKRVPKNESLEYPWVKGKKHEKHHSPLGEKWWYNPVTDHQVKSKNGCPGAGYENRRRPSSMSKKSNSGYPTNLK
jgi:hypothetical protein